MRNTDIEAAIKYMEQELLRDDLTDEERQEINYTIAELYGSLQMEDDLLLIPPDRI